jgi:Arc/MetJ-type ribon-helix-helix transcriptional regulator
MDASQNGCRISIWLVTEYHAFVEKFMAAGTFESRDELFTAALDALAREIEASAREAAANEGHPNAEEASLEELADMLDQSGRWREN